MLGFYPTLCCRHHGDSVSVGHVLARLDVTGRKANAARQLRPQCHWRRGDRAVPGSISRRCNPIDFDLFVAACLDQPETRTGASPSENPTSSYRINTTAMATFETLQRYSEYLRLASDPSLGHQTSNLEAAPMMQYIIFHRRDADVPVVDHPP